MDRTPYSAASMTNSTHGSSFHGRPSSMENGNHHLNDSDVFDSLPESPFTKNIHQLNDSPFGLDPLPHETSNGSIFSSMHGLNLGVAPGLNGGLLSNQFGNLTLDTQNLQQEEDDASFLDLPFACNDMEEDTLPSDVNSSSHDNLSSSSIPVSSFVSLVDSAPKLSLFEPTSCDINEGASTVSSIDDELREFQLFGQALRS